MTGKRMILVAVLLLSLTGVCNADLKITGTLSVPRDTLVRLKAEGADATAGLVWRVSPRKGISRATTKQETFEFVAPPGNYEVDLLSVRLIDKNTVIEEASVSVTVTEGTPTPTPVPPTPTPPIPPTPPAPIPVSGLRVLILFDADNKTLPKEQQQILISGTVQDYLDSKCITGPDSKTREWRIWPYDIGTAGESKLWQDAMSRKPTKDKMPWIIISDGKTGYEGPLPSNITETMALLKKYGG